MAAVSYITDAVSHPAHNLKVAGRKTKRAAKFASRKTVKVAGSTLVVATSFLALFGMCLLFVAFYALLFNLLAMGCVALGLAAEWAIVPFFFLLWSM